MSDSMYELITPARVAHLAAILEAGDRAAYGHDASTEDANRVDNRLWHYTDHAVDLLIAAQASIERRAFSTAGFESRPFTHRPQTAEERKRAEELDAAEAAGELIEYQK